MKSNKRAPSRDVTHIRKSSVNRHYELTQESPLNPRILHVETGSNGLEECLRGNSLKERILFLAGGEASLNFNKGGLFTCEKRFPRG